MTRGYLASLAQARADTLHAQEEEARAEATPCTQEENLLAVRLILDRLYDTASPIDALEHATTTWCAAATRVEYLTCEECDRRTVAGYVYGAYVLCRACATRRLVTAAQLRTESQFETSSFATSDEGAEPEALLPASTERAAA